MSLPGELCHHDSTVRANTRVTCEIGCHGPYWVRIRTAGVIIYREHLATETKAREWFEKVVERHQLGLPQERIEDAVQD